MLYLRQSTAATVKVGPFVDDADGKTPETGLTIAQASVLLSKADGALTQKHEATSATHDAGGFYGVPLDTTDTNTIGRLQVSVQVAGALPAWADFEVLDEAVYDALFGTTALSTLAAGAKMDIVDAPSATGVGVIVDAVWDETSTGHTDAGKAGAQQWTVTNAIAAVFSGITSLAAWLRGLARKDAMDATAKSELNTGGGTYNETTDSAEALRDRGDAAWVTATGFETAGAAAAALNTAIPGSPAANSINQRITALDDLLQASGSGDAAAIKTAAEKVAALVETAGGHDRFLAAALEAAPSGGSTPADISAVVTPAVAAAITSDHGSGSYVNTGGGSGAWPVTLTVQDGSAVKVQNAKVHVASPEVGTQTTNALGVTTWALDAGTYTVYVGSSAQYTPAASYTVVVSAEGAVTGGTLAVTAATLPSPAAGSYLLYGYEYSENQTAFGAAAMTVKVVSLALAGRVDAGNNLVNSVLGTDVATDANGLWSMSIPQNAFTQQAMLTLERTWTAHDGSTTTERMRAKLVAPTTGSSVAWADLSPTIAT